MPLYPLNNFTAGEVSPKLESHTDLQRYRNACKTMQNFLPDPLGGAFLAGGTQFLAETHYDRLARLIPFIYNISSCYVIELTDYRARFYQSKQLISTEDPPGVPYSIESYYSQAQLAELQWCQSGDYLFMTQGDVYPTSFARTNSDSFFPTFTQAKLPILDGPYLDINKDINTTISPSPTWGFGLTLTANAAIFNEQHVGALFRLKQSGKSARKNLTTGVDYTDTIAIYGKFSVDITPYQATTSDPIFIGKITLKRSYDLTNWTDVASFFYATKQDFFETQANVYYRLYLSEWTSGVAIASLYQDESWGCAKVTQYLTPETVLADAVVSFASTDPTADWREGAWSPYRGFPRAIAFFQGRLVFAGTAHQPQTVWMSWTDDYYNFNPDGTTDDGAITITADARDSSPYFWLLSRKLGLVAGGMSSIDLFETGNGSPITPSNMPTYSEHPPFGCANGLRPYQVTGAFLHCDRTRKKILEIIYSWEQDSLDSTQLTQIAEHITEPGIMAMAFQSVPIQRLWCVLADGTAGILTYLRKEQVVGWSRFVTTGTIKDVCVLPTTFGREAGTEDVFFVVERSGKMCVEAWVSNNVVTTIEDCWYVDSAISGTDVTPFTDTAAIGLMSHLEGQTVTGLMDGMVIPPSVVSDGRIILPYPVTSVTVGLGRIGVLVPMKIDVPVQGGTICGKKRKVSRAWIRFYKSLGGKVGTTLANAKEIPELYPEMIMNQPIPFVSRLVEVQSFPSDPQIDEDSICIVQDQPLPCNVLGVVLDVATY